MPTLRVAVLMLMLVLLPLRGWAGGAMALEHTPQAPAASHAHVPGMEAAASPCHGAPAAQLEAADTGADTTTSGHTCSLCDVCHSQLLAATPVAASAPTPGATHPVLRGAAFASAPARHQLKPPRA